MTDLRHTIPDWGTLVDRVCLLSTHKDSKLHGVHHWQCVAWTGLQLLPEVPKADPAIVLLFALFHDAMRVHDGHDPDHGRRGGKLARQLNGTSFHLSEERMALLQAACYGHNESWTTRDPTGGVCWDADRLNLWRCGVRPDPARLCTAAARQHKRILWARGLMTQHFDWDIIFSEYDRSMWREYAAAV